MITKTPDLETIAKRVAWWKTPGATLADIDSFLCRTESQRDQLIAAVLAVRDIPDVPKLSDSLLPTRPSLTQEEAAEFERDLGEARKRLGPLSSKWE